MRDEQEGLCRPRSLVRLLIQSNLQKSRVRSTIHQAIRQTLDTCPIRLHTPAGDMMASFQIPVLLEVKFPTAMTVPELPKRFWLARASLVSTGKTVRKD